MSPRREAFYWAAVLATFAMGTAVGDLVAYRAGLGFLSAGLVFAVLFAIPGLGYRYFNLNAVFAFWFAYVLTRPLGASFADWMGKSHAGGGLNYGDGPVSLALAILMSHSSATSRSPAPTKSQHPTKTTARRPTSPTPETQRTCSAAGISVQRVDNRTVAGMRGRRE